MERTINRLRILKYFPEGDTYTHITTIFGNIAFIGNEDIVTMSSTVALKTYGERKMEIGDAFLIVGD